MSTDKDWETWGAKNPYFGVLSNKKYFGSDAGANDRDFFESGIYDIEHVMEFVLKLGHAKKFEHAVDFGCGVGRLTIPLANHAKKVTGLDVSPSVLEEAEKKLPAKIARHVTYETSDDGLNKLPRKYDFVHSYIVMQHIPPARGEAFIKKLLEGLSPDGVAALHVTFAHNASRFNRMVIFMRNHVLPLHYVLNIWKGRPLATPRMRMYLYDINKVLRIFNDAGFPETLQFATDHGGYLGMMIVGKKVNDKS